MLFRSGKRPRQTQKHIITIARHHHQGSPRNPLENVLYTHGGNRDLLHDYVEPVLTSYDFGIEGSRNLLDSQLAQHVRARNRAQ